MTATALKFAPQGFAAVADNDNEPGGLAFLVGELRGELRGVRDLLKEMQAEGGLRDEKLDDIARRVTTVESTVTVLGGVVAKQTTRVDKIEPVALWLITIASGLLLVGGALWYGVMTYGNAVLDWIVSLRQPK